MGEQFQITCNATNDKDAPHNIMFTWMTPDGVDPIVNMTSEDDDHTASSTLYISILARSDNELTSVMLLTIMLVVQV